MIDEDFLTLVTYLKDGPLMNEGEVKTEEVFYTKELTQNGESLLSKVYTHSLGN